MKTAQNIPTEDLYMIVLLRGGDDDDDSHKRWVSRQFASSQGKQIADSVWTTGLTTDEAMAVGKKIATQNSNYFVCVIRHRQVRSVETAQAVFLSENCQDCPVPPLVSKTPPRHANLQQTLDHYRSELDERIQRRNYTEMLEQRKRVRQKLIGEQ